MSTTVIRVRDYRGPVVAATCAKCHSDNLKPFGGPALSFCSHCGVRFPQMFGNIQRFQSMHGTDSCWNCNSDYGLHVEGYCPSEQITPQREGMSE